MDGADLGCLTVVDHQLSHVDIAARDEQPEKAVYPSSFVSHVYMMPSLDYLLRVQEYFHNVYFFLSYGELFL